MLSIAYTASPTSVRPPQHHRRPTRLPKAFLRLQAALDLGGRVAAIDDAAPMLSDDRASAVAAGVGGPCSLQ